VLRKIQVFLVTAVLAASAVLVADPAPAAAAPPARAGTLLSATDITSQADTRIAGAAKVIAIRYLSPGADGHLVPVRGTVFLPTAQPKTGWRLLGFAHGTSGIGTDCTVTDRMGTGGRYDDWLGPWLRDGYVVAATEYAGIGGPGEHVYLDGETAGANLIDAVRAGRTVAARETHRPMSKGYVTEGGSQGGHASLSAGRLAEQYSGELVNVGTVANSAPLNIVEYFKLVRPGMPPVAVPDYAAYFSYVLAGLKRARPDVNVDSYLTPLGRTLIRKAQSACYQDLTPQTADVPVGDLVSRPLADGPLIPALSAQISVPPKGFAAPVLVEQGAFDPVSPAPLTWQWVEQARGNGVTVTVKDYPAGHGIGPQADRDALAWVNGLPWPTS